VAMNTLNARCVSVLKEDTLSTACRLTMLILSVSFTFSVTCLTIAYLITKSCQQCWPILLFILQGSALANFRFGGMF